MKLKVKQMSIKETGHYEVLSHEVQGKLISSDEIGEGVKEDSYLIGGDEVMITKKWNIRNDKEGFYETGEFQIIFKRGYNSIWGYNENKIYPKHIELLSVEREENSEEWKREVMQWNVKDGHRRKYCYKLQIIDPKTYKEYLLETDIESKARQMIYNIVKDWYYDIEY